MNNSKKLYNKKIYNSVVKIITTNVELDILKPYNIVNQSKSVGAGFFIDMEGHILTAAHVVKNTIEIWLNIPDHGKEIFKAKTVCVYPDFDLAIIKVLDFKNTFYLTLGNSDTLNLGDIVYALGYPDGSNHPMRTSGTISGRRDDYIQADVPINPGNSGGPLFNSKNNVIGVSSAVLSGSEDSSLIIPINKFKAVKEPMLNSDSKIIYKNVLGILLVNGNDNYGELYNVEGICKEGPIIKKILKASPLYNKADEGDILCKINEYKIDYYGDVDVKWEDGKVPLDYIVKRTKPYGNVKITIYSIKDKQHKELNIKLKSFFDIYPVRQIFTHIEKLDFEVFGGLIVMNLNLDHILTKFPHLVHLIVNEEIYNSYLVITHIFGNSKISQFETISIGSLIDTVNNIKVRTLDEYRKAILKPVSKKSNEFIIIKTMNNDMVILKLNELLKQESKLIKQYTYEESNTSLELKKYSDEERDDSDDSDDSDDRGDSDDSDEERDKENNLGLLL